MLVAVAVIETACLDITLNGKHIALAEKPADILSVLAPCNTADKVNGLVAVCLPVNRKAELRADTSVLRVFQFNVTAKPAHQIYIIHRVRSISISLTRGFLLVCSSLSACFLSFSGSLKNRISLSRTSLISA